MAKRRLGWTDSEHSAHGAKSMQEAVRYAEDAQTRLTRGDCAGAVQEILHATASVGAAVAHSRSGGSVPMHNVDFVGGVRKQILGACVVKRRRK